MATSTRLTGRWLARPWGRLRVWEAGSGPVCIALHGLGGSGRYWQGLAARVADRFTVVAPDLAGFGHSDMPADVTYDRTFHLANIDALVDDVAAGGRRVIVVGHSLGAVLAGLWTARTTDRLAALALVAAPFPSGQGRAAQGPPEGGERRGGPSRAYATLQALWPILTLPVRSRVFPRPVIVDYIRSTPRSYWQTASNILWDDAAARDLEPLRRLRDRPVLLLSAVDDRRVPAADTDRWSELLPSADRVVTSGGHQLLLRTHFETLAAWLLER
ncbi:MAG TPA: alpha/beta fold hydrolase [Candidatus Dormibacteraeota bacterium]|nr:alpha/beta fold hydrolase [Candidatus Dormibacteraeota bacterium]